MHWLQSLDTALFHFINGALANPFFDWLMPVLSGNRRAVAHRRRSLPCRPCCFRLDAAENLRAADGAGRRRSAIRWSSAPSRTPFPARARSSRCPMRGSSAKPAKATSRRWPTARCRPTPTSTAFPPPTRPTGLRWRRSRFYFTGAAHGSCFRWRRRVAFSRVYNGVHYPSDVTAGAILGAGYAIAFIVLVQSAWNLIGRKFFPSWHAQMPSS